MPPRHGPHVSSPQHVQILQTSAQVVQPVGQSRAQTVKPPVVVASAQLVPANPVVGVAQSGIGGSDWDANNFERRLRAVDGDRDATKNLLREVARHNYQISRDLPIPKTTLVSCAECHEAEPSLKRLSKTPRVLLTNSYTGDALVRLGHGRDGTVCAMNFANGGSVGGGYTNGAVAQEEDLCRQIPTLYTSLLRAKKHGAYPFGPQTYKGADFCRYCDVTYTPDLVVSRGGRSEGYRMLMQDEQVTVSIVSAAAPNLRARVPEIFDDNLMGGAITDVFVAPRLKDSRVDTLILGAWGCGAFGCDAEKVASLFAHALTEQNLGSLYREVHFCVPIGHDKNYDIFKKVLQNALKPTGIQLEVD